MQPPLSGDEAALKKYADQMEALRKQVQCLCASAGCCQSCELWRMIVRC